jgi:hypothetical protein
MLPKPRRQVGPVMSGSFFSRSKSKVVENLLSKTDRKGYIREMAKTSTDYGLKWIGKPDSVMAHRMSHSDHSSWLSIAREFERPYPRAMGGPPNPPIWPCSRWGLPCVRHYWRTGELLPRHFNLTGRENGRRYDFCGTFPRSLGAAINGHLVLWSPDFPRFVRHEARSLNPL